MASDGGHDETIEGGDETVNGDDEELSPDRLADSIEGGAPVSILDVRNREEAEAWQIEGSGVVTTHVPHVKFVSAQVTGDAADLVDPDESYLVVCPRGEASDEVARTLREDGVDAVNLAGGMQGWARVYRETTLPLPGGDGSTGDGAAGDGAASDDAAGDDAADGGAPDFEVVQFRRPASGCLAYAIVADGEALVVDPLRAFTHRYDDAIADRDATVEYVLDTHVHADHVSGLRTLAEATGATPILSTDAADRGVEFDVETVADGDELVVGDVSVEVLATPGHTSGSISLRAGDVLLTGDALFLDGVPRPDLEAGNEGASEYAAILHDTLTDRLASLPDGILVAPGHFVTGEPPGEDGTYTATLGDLRERLRAFDEDPETFVDRITGTMGARPANCEQIIRVNLGQETVDEETAFEMELGPNNCAVSD